MYAAPLGTFLQRDPLPRDGESIIGYSHQAVARIMTSRRSRFAPMQNETNLNLYAYAKSSPGNFVDPYGLDEIALSDVLEFLQDYKDAKEAVEALKKKSITYFEGVMKQFGATGLLEDEIIKIVSALEQFDVKSNCGKWYKQTYLAILNAGTKCRRGFCEPIDKIGQYGEANSWAAKCFVDILEEAGNTTAANFKEIARALAEKCGDLPRTSKNCKCK